MEPRDGDGPKEFAVVTDSAACIPKELRLHYGIAVVPIIFQIAGETYRDGDSLNDDKFYALLQRSAEQPTTAASPPGDFLDGFREAAQGTRNVICVTLGSNFSGNYASAMRAADLAKSEMGGIEIQVVDSRNAAMAEGFVALAAARAGSFAEAIREAEAVTQRARLLGVLDTLDYVARSGRVPKVFAWASSLLQIKPIFEYHDSEVNPLERVRTRSRSIERLLDLTEQRLQPNEALHIAVIHARAKEEADELAAKVRDRLDPTELLITEFSQAMAIHTGPGLLGLAFYNE
jgi:DegV family protein with EDD domain